MKEETLSSFAIRSLYISGIIDIDKICSRLFLRGRTEWKLFPSANAELLTIFSQVIEQIGVDNAITNHTLAPLYQPVSGVNLRALERSRLTRAYDKDPGTSMPMSFSSAEILSSNIKHCPMCFSEQVDEFGFPWFKREWQIHKMESCLVHGCLLFSRCGCGRKGNRSSLSISMLRGYCTYCDARFSAPNASETDSTYAAWLRNMLDANLPTFSPKLRAFLIIESAFKLGLKRSAKHDEISYFLTRLYDPSFIAQPNFGPENWTRNHTAERNYTNRLSKAMGKGRHPLEFTPIDHIIPHTCLFHPLSCAFPIFSDFLAYLDQVSYRSQEKTYFHEIEDILELNSTEKL